MAACRLEDEFENILPILFDHLPTNIVGLDVPIDAETLQTKEIHESKLLQCLNVLDYVPLLGWCDGTNTPQSDAESVAVEVAQPQTLIGINVIRDNEIFVPIISLLHLLELLNRDALEGWFLGCHSTFIFDACHLEMFVWHTQKLANQHASIDGVYIPLHQREVNILTNLLTFTQVRWSLESLEIYWCHLNQNVFC